jgi:hypothetical protein
VLTWVILGNSRDFAPKLISYKQKLMGCSSINCLQPFFIKIIIKTLIRIFKYIILLLVIYLPSYGQDYINPQNLMGLNSNADDFAPVWNIYEHKLYYNSTREGCSMFYISSPSTDFQFNEFSLLKGPLNNPKTNQSYITFVDNDFALLARYSLKKERSYINIAKARFERNTWTKAFDDENLSVEAFCGFPNVSPDGKFLVFSSDQNTQNKDLDLWFSLADDKENWSKPIQLLELNTPGNEIAPFLLSSDTLVFASDGMEGPGKFDLYFSVKRAGSWSTPMPLAGLNSEFNEIGFARLPDGHYIFASDRPGGKGGLDLYSCSKANPNTEVKADIDELQLNITTQTTVIRLIRESQTILVLAPKNKYDQKQLDTNFVYDRFLSTAAANSQGFSEIIVDSQLIIKPKKLDLMLDAGPAGMLDSWTAYLLTSAQKKEIASGREMPYSKMVEIESMFLSPIMDDSLIVLLSAKSKSSVQYDERFLMNFSKSISSGLKTFKDNDGSYREILMPAGEPIKEEILNEIVSNSTVSSKIIIEYYSDGLQNQASILKKALENKLKRKQIVIKSVKYTLNNNFSGNIAPQIFKLKLIID